MEKYDFDKVIDRRITDALKIEVLQARYRETDLLLLWVADMGFETSPVITDALHRR
ncbi:hypothetical protein [Tannerella sp.]|uniref:hypothetical protein n=1 Tax=Tannerella sp. TaxID=2382127 RepID=UPI0026DC94CE|nr:hypothetical protein [Tannerella sp.]MDO4702365.1 hypothetical protein [Tannerella sp.]